MIRQPGSRIGVAHSRDVGSSAARATFSPSSTATSGSIRVVWTVRRAAARVHSFAHPAGLRPWTYPVSYGASLTLCTERGFSPADIESTVRKKPSPRYPGSGRLYTIPRSV